MKFRIINSTDKNIIGKQIELDLIPYTEVTLFDINFFINKVIELENNMYVVDLNNVILLLEKIE